MSSMEHLLLQPDDCPRRPLRFVARLFRSVLPEAKRQLRYWRGRAAGIPDPQLRRQALASLTHKRFHADGGCVYAATSIAHRSQLVRLIVALQTISDYLDNLCDRTGSTDEVAFTRLHDAMRDAVRPHAVARHSRHYYGTELDPDDGYLCDLVRTCQQEILHLPGYDAVASRVEWMVERYCELQQKKHSDVAQRTDCLETWSERWRAEFPTVNWWEFSAATGSTLGMFALFAAATEDLSHDQATAISRSYFPWICGLHILLDYLIDLEEDAREGDFNFVRCYPNERDVFVRLREFARRSLRCANSLATHSSIHRFVVHGLLAMYLSDRKTRRVQAAKSARRLVFEFGPIAWLFYGACVLYRAVR